MPAPDEGEPRTVRVIIPPPGVLWTVILGAAAIALAFAAIAIIGLMASALAVIFIAVVVAQALAPLVGRLQRWMPRLAAIVLIYLLLLLLLGGLALLVIPPLIAETQQVSTQIPQLFHRAGHLLDRIAPGSGTTLTRAVEPRVLDLAGGLTLPTGAVLQLGTGFVAVFFVSIYWLLAMPNLHRFVLSLFPAARHPHVDDILHDLAAALGGYVRGLAVNAVVLAVVTYVVLLALGVKYPLVLAVITLAGQFIPLIGPTIAQFLAAGLALLSSPLQAIVVLVYFVVVQQISGNVILPLAVKSQTNISPLLITGAVFLGLWVGGIIGGSIAIPLAAVLQVVVLRIAVPAVRHWSGADSAVSPSDHP